jgi:hypothetical protein
MNSIDFRAIEIIPGIDCDCALSKLAGMRVLYNDVLKLFTSSHSNCSCTFKHFDDRRHNIDKRKFDSDDLTLNSNRRTCRYGRRAIDIHNRSRDRFATQRVQGPFIALQQAG